MEAAKEPLALPPGKLDAWRERVRERLPDRIKNFRRVSGGVFLEGNRLLILEARQVCEAYLQRIETERPTATGIEPQALLTIVRPLEEEKLAGEALDELCRFVGDARKAKEDGGRGVKDASVIERPMVSLPDVVHEVFRTRWFGYLCGSFRFEIKHNRPVARILNAITLARLSDQLRQVEGHLETAITQSKTEILAAIGTPPGRAHVDPYATVPPKPPTYVDRPDILGALRERILSDSHDIPLTVLEGMGGAGKTVVAIALCHDVAVRQAFPDGIVWVSAGKESGQTNLDRARFIAEALNQDSALLTDTNYIFQYRSFMKGKAVLVVLDDVWTQEDIAPFRTSGQSRLLFTTRDRSLAGQEGAISLDIGLLDEVQSREFLARWSRRELPPEPHATGIVQECNGLALGVSMIGAALKGKADADWGYLLDDLKQARLRDIAGRPGGYAHQTLHAAIEVSVNALDASDAPDQPMKARYLKLAVLLENVPAAEPMLRTMWSLNGKTGEREVHRTIRFLAERSLAVREGNGIRLHDLQLDYLRDAYTDKETLGLLRSAYRRSVHVVGKEPMQFASQMTGRLLPFRQRGPVREALDEIRKSAPRPWLRPLRPALDAGSELVQKVLEGHTDTVTCAAFSRDGKHAISASVDSTLIIWDIEGRQPPKVLAGHNGAVRCLALSHAASPEAPSPYQLP
jgi:hypothetical protein